MFKCYYSWPELKQLYIQKNKEIADRTSNFAEFLVNLTTAALGGKSENKDQVSLDTGEGIDELTEDQIEMWKGILGEAEFYKTYPQFAE